MLSAAGPQYPEVMKRACSLLVALLACIPVSAPAGAQERKADPPAQDVAYVIDSTRARTELGWRPAVTIDEGLAEVVRWVNEGWSEIVRLPLEYRHAA